MQNSTKHPVPQPSSSGSTRKPEQNQAAPQSPTETAPNGHHPNGSYTNGHSAHGAHEHGAHEHGAHEHGTNGHGNAMPTTIYGAVDKLREQLPPTDEPQRGRTTAPDKIYNVSTDVPLGEGELPRPRSLRMQIRFLRGLFFAAWLFARVLFWQVYVRRYFPRFVDATNQRRWVKYARQFRGFAISMGGVYIKLGQFISTRVDALPEEIVRELESLQDEVPTIQFKKIRRVLESQLGSLDARFEWFNESPIAAASLGQAHRAKLRNGDRVVVKVQRPGIRDVCYTDLRTLQIVTAVAARFKFITRRADPVALGDEFGRVLLEELSYNHEAQNAKRFYVMFQHDMGVYIPEIYDEHSTDQILTMEDVTSIKLNDYAALEAAGINRKEVAERLMETYLKQVFEHFFFHADPHPGNLFVYPLPVDEADERKYIQNGGGRPFYLIFIDFGMTGTLTREIADGMVTTLGAVIARDPAKLVRSYQELGFLLPNADIPRIIEATEAAFNEVWGLSMTEIRDMDYQRAVNLASEFNDLIKSMPFYIPQDFIYLGRTISILSGMSTSLDPAFNPWHELEPYARRLAAKGFGIDVSFAEGDITPTSVIRSLFNGSGSQALVNIAQELNRRTAPINPSMQVLEQLRSGDVRVIAEPDSSTKAHYRRMELQASATRRAVVFGGVLVASSVLYTSGEPTLGVIGFAFCGLSALYGFIKG